jgi:hypothetical protein
MVKARFSPDLKNFFMLAIFLFATSHPHTMEAKCLTFQQKLTSKGIQMGERVQIRCLFYGIWMPLLTFNGSKSAVSTLS